jgi:hypothetical protein
MAMKSLTLNKKLNAYMFNFDYKFTINKDYINFREMCKNFHNEQIPTLEIAKAVGIVLGPAPKPANSYDPRPKNWRNSTVEDCEGKYEEPTIAYVEFTELALLTSCNRDIMPKQVEKYEKNFKHRNVSTICCIKNPIDGSYIIWDGDHTSILCFRQGYTHARIQYIQADPKDKRDPKIILKELILKAAESFTTLNGPGRKKMDKYDLHLILVDSGDPDACAIQQILDRHNVHLVRNKRFKSDGCIGHYDSVFEVYKRSNGTSIACGVILDRALGFIRKYFPQQPVETYLLTALGNIFESGLQSKTPVPSEWDAEVGPILKKYGDGSASKLFDRFLADFRNAHGCDPANRRAMVANSILKLYQQESGAKAPIQVIPEGAM